MTHKFRVLGLAFVAVLAMSAVVASAASAVTFTSAAYPASISGEQTGAVNEFETSIGNVECETGTFSGTLSGASSEISLAANYGGCLVGGLLPATVEMTGCHYVFKSSGADSVTADVVCSPSTDTIDITIPAANCTVTVGAQTGLASITLTNSSPNVIAHVAVNNIKYSYDQTKAGGCSGKSGAQTGGIYTSTVKLKGNNGAISFD